MAEAFSWAGARVAITSRNRTEVTEQAEAIAATTGSEVAGIEADVARDAGVAAAVDGTVARFGALDILVNNAGVLVRGRLDEVGRADFEHSVEVNGTGP